MRTVFTTVLWASGFDSYQTQLTLTGHGYLIESDIWEECSLLNTSCGCYVSRSFVMAEPSVMRTVFTTVLWASGFDSYQTQLTLTGHGYLIDSDIFGRSVACRIPAVGVLCLVHSHGWALRDENSFHDGLMSFWLWFLPNSAHSDGPWLCDWKRYIWEECSLLNTSCGCYVSRSLVMVEPSVMRTVFTTVLWASGFDSYQTQLTLTGHGYLIESDIWEECSLLNTSCGCYVSRSFVMVEPSVMRTVFTTVLWASGFDSYQTQLTLTGHGYVIESDIFGRSVACWIPVVGVMCPVHWSWLSPPWWEQFSRRSYELLALILTKLSSLWRAMATWLTAIYLGGV